MRKFIFFAQTITIFYAFIAKGATIKGIIKETNGNILPYSTVFIEGTTIGASANGLGAYELTLTPGQYVVNCQFIGFKQSFFKVTVLGNETITHDFILANQSLELKEVQIHTNNQDPAYRIIKAAIEKRSFHLGQVKEFQTSIYTKALIKSRKLPEKFMGAKMKTPDLDVDSLGKGVLYLSEQYSDYYASQGKEQTIIRAVHESGNPNGLGLAQLPKVLSFYENNLSLFSARGSVSPIGERALSYYNYKLLGEFEENSKIIYKINVTQKRPLEPCFNGTIYIAADDYAIQSLDLMLLKESGLDLVDTVKIQQLFLPLKPDEWVIKSQNMYITVNIFAFDITADLLNVYNNQKVNEPIPDSIFHKNIATIYDKNAQKIDTSFWAANRPVVLEHDENKNFLIQDSLNKKTTTKGYLDSARKRANKLKPFDLIGGKTFLTYRNKNTIGFNSALSFINYNAVEGLNFAPKAFWNHLIDSGKTISNTVGLRYGCINTHFNAMFKFIYTTEDKYWRGRKWLLGGELGKYIFQYATENPVYPTLNTITSLLWQENDLKLYERWTSALFVERNYGNGFFWQAKFSYQERYPLYNTSTYSFDSKNSVFENNIPPYLSTIAHMEKHHASLFHLQMAYKPGTTYVQYPEYKRILHEKNAQFTLSYDKGLPNILGSKVNYDKYKFSFQDLEQLHLLGLLGYHIAIGGFLNTQYVAMPDLNSLYGNRGLGIASPYLNSFQFAQFYQFSNKQGFYSEGHLEYKMKGFISNKLPLLKRAKLYFVTGGNTFYSNNNLYYAEAFFGIENIGFKSLRVFRLDFVQSWDGFEGHNNGLRLGISGGGFKITNNKTGETGADW